MSAGIADVETREITVQRTFQDFDEFASIGFIDAEYRSNRKGYAAG